MIFGASKFFFPLALCIWLTFFAARPAHALAFAPTQTEWATWPDYCRARYVVSGSGTGSQFAYRVSQTEVSRHEIQIGAEAWYYLHHYCAALIYLGRAAIDMDGSRAEYWLGEAEANFMAQYQRIGRDNLMFPDTIIGIAQLHQKRGNPKTALRFLNEAIAAQPKATSPYALAAIIYRRAGKPEQAISILLQGDAAVDGRSAELHYFLGLTYIEIDELDSAVEHARLAYDLGYPLPGLASKLDRLGHSLE